MKTDTVANHIKTIGVSMASLASDLYHVKYQQNHGTNQLTTWNYTQLYSTWTFPETPVLAAHFHF